MIYPAKCKLCGAEARPVCADNAPFPHMEYLISGIMAECRKGVTGCLSNSCPVPGWVPLHQWEAYMGPSRQESEKGGAA
tara:strand:+ start:1168 stop:1404 length:237 start_codon:yes stop_codon:yes gene_type:complete